MKKALNVCLYFIRLCCIGCLY